MNSKAGVAAAVAGGLLLGLLVIVGGIFAAQDELDQAACNTFPAIGPGTGEVPAGGVVVAHANIKVGMSAEGWRSDLAKTVASSPDLVSLNEMFQRSVKDVVKAAPGYAGYRDEGAKGQERSTMVLWRTDRWSRVDAGRVTIVDAGPNKWDAGRSATWVTLQDSDGARVSMVSVHHMIDPIASPKRQAIFQAGMVKTGQLMIQLAQQGPVFMAGDLNAHYGRKNANWAPAPVLKPMGFKSTFEAMGPLRTHRPQGVIDYIFFQPSMANPTGQDTTLINSDHLVLTAVFDMVGGADSSNPSDETSQPTDQSTGKGGKGGQKGRPTAGTAGRQVVAAKPKPSASSSTSTSTVAATGKIPVVPGFDAEQVRNAVAIVAAGVELGVPARAQAIAVMTAMGESSLRVLDYGDGVGPDSRGLFQQRDNGAWGTYEDRMDPRRSSLNFYKALLRVQGWEQMAPTLAAHETQRNADPYHYEKYWDGALELFKAITGAGAVSAALQGGASNDCDEVVLTAGASGSVVWPIAASMKDSDRKNWGGTGSAWSRGHTGTDFSVSCGVPVFAAHAGTVVIDRNQSWAGPHLVKVSTGPGSLTTWYAHMQKVTVPEGTVVAAGQQIGEVGAEGNVRGATGCHLHFEVHPKNGSIYADNINPSTWLAQNVGKAVPVSGGEQPGEKKQKS